jgi:hypothetical protein
VIDLHALIVVIVILMVYVHVMIISIIGHLNTAARGMMVVNYHLECIVIPILLTNIVAGWVFAALMAAPASALTPNIEFLKIDALIGILLLLIHHLLVVPRQSTILFAHLGTDLIAPTEDIATLKVPAACVMTIYIIGHPKNAALGTMVEN